MEYHFSKIINSSFNEAVEKVKEELKREGFGIIAETDLHDIFKKKLDVDFREYIILSVFNLRHAYEILLEEDTAGIFLPFHVVIQEHENKNVEISAVNPEELMSKVNNLNLRSFATGVKETLQEVLNRC